MSNNIGHNANATDDRREMETILDLYKAALGLD